MLPPPTSAVLSPQQERRDDDNGDPVEAPVDASIEALTVLPGGNTSSQEDDSIASRDRVFRGQPAKVTLGFISGETKIGTVGGFFDDAPELMVTTSSKLPSGEVREMRHRISTKDLCYVAFHKRDEPVAWTLGATLREFDVHLPGGKKFNVEAAADAVMHPIGFYAVPLSKFSLFDEMFFFARGVNAIEDKEPLGSIMVREGFINPEAIEKGLNEQIAAQNAPIGQILVEQNKLTDSAVQDAAEEQRAMARQGRPLRLGEVLVEAGLATDEDIESALKEQKKRKGKRLGEVLVDLGIVKESDVSKTLAAKFHLPYVDLDEQVINTEAIKEVPTGLIQKYRVFPYATDEHSISIAIGDPLAMETIDMLRFSVIKRINEVVVMPSQLEKHILTYVEDLDSGRHSEVRDILEEMGGEEEESDLGSQVARDFGEEGEDDTAVARLVNRIIIDAFRRGASDIHIEPYSKKEATQVRFRVDGVCHLYQKIPAAYRKRVVARLKVMAHMDITERRKPQDGKIRFKIGKKSVELRVATIPTVPDNEDVVLRILASGEPMPLSVLALSDYNIRELKTIVQRPYGLILVVGPTGSGKTTTLHSMLGEINIEDRKIWTAEDPVEITQAGLRQVQVHPKIGFTFAAAMRAFLRADPDVIMVGEMRDQETASTAVEASLTGHLVLSTLHTNSAPETITRLIDMGLDPFSFADALLGVLAQRLAKGLCPACRSPDAAEQEEQEQVASVLGEARLEQLLKGEALKLWRAEGCDTCKGSGYKGRVGVHELLIATPEIRHAIQHQGTVDEIFDLAQKQGMRTLLQDGVEKCLSGLTDLKQVLAVCNR